MIKRIEIPSSDKKLNSTLDQEYWNSKWQGNQIGWDIGYASPAICAYMDQYPNKEAQILIAGCGNAHEAVYLLEHNFKHITLIDFAPEAIKRVKAKFADQTAVNVLCTDFFEHEGQYELLLEQTFFCAIAPERRAEYVQKVSSLLRPNGRMVGVLFDQLLDEPGPPFGGDLMIYQQLFTPNFILQTMEKCYNSIKPRIGKEVFINFLKREDVNSNELSGFSSI